jgi:DNA-damage-inducible protein J
MPASNYTVKFDESDRRAAEQIFSELGLTLAAGLNVYIKAVVRHRRIPFDMALNSLPDNKLTPEQRAVAQTVLSNLENISKDGFTEEDKESFAKWDNGDFRLNFEKRLP